MHFHLVEEYKKLNFSHGLLSLWSGKLFFDLGLNIFGLFLPIVMFKEFGSMTPVIFWWISHSLGYVLLVPLTGRLMNNIGFRNSMIIGTLLRVPYFYAFYKFADDPFVYAALASVALILIRIFFWMPFQTDSAKFSSKSNRGKQFGLIYSVASILSIIAPVIGGFILDQWSFAVLSLVSMVVCLLAVIPFFFLPEVKEEVSWSYGETFKYFFHPFNRRMVVAYMSDGAVGVINGLFWPIFMFSILDEKFKALGLLTGGILLAGMLLRLFIGQLLDKFKKVKLVRFGTFLTASAWVWKVTVVTALQVFLSSMYHAMALVVLRTSLDTLVYEKAADRGHYIDEYTLIKEMAIHSGKVIALIVIIGMLFIFPLQASFILAAILSLFIALLR